VAGHVSELVKLGVESGKLPIHALQLNGPISQRFLCSLAFGDVSGGDEYKFNRSILCKFRDEAGMIISEPLGTRESDFHFVRLSNLKNPAYSFSPKAAIGLWDSRLLNGLADNCFNRLSI
jgi:hypothetical protein